MMYVHTRTHVYLYIRGPPSFSARQYKGLLQLLYDVKEQAALHPLFGKVAVPVCPISSRLIARRGETGTIERLAAPHLDCSSSVCGFVVGTSSSTAADLYSCDEVHSHQKRFERFGQYPRNRWLADPACCKLCLSQDLVRTQAIGSSVGCIIFCNRSGNQKLYLIFFRPIGTFSFKLYTRMGRRVNQSKFIWNVQEKNVERAFLVKLFVVHRLARRRKNLLPLSCARPGTATIITLASVTLAATSSSTSTPNGS